MMDSIGETSPAPQRVPRLQAEKVRQPLSTPQKSSQTIAERNWRKCLDRYEMETAHEDFFHYLCQSRNFSFGIHCYREVLTLQGSDIVAERMIQRLYAAMQVYWHVTDIAPRSWLVRKKWLLLGLGIVAVILFMGLSYEEHRPLLGLGFAGLLLVLGLNSKWISRL